jgi:GntR family transcriptional regulator/MocR family aminotransferase
MTRAKLSAFPPLGPSAAGPYYRQIYDRVRGAIATGVLKPADRIPSARALADELGLARGTVEMAYSLLAAEGYIQARGQAGTVVAPEIRPTAALAAPMPQPVVDPTRTSFRPDSILPFQMGLPALDAFPRKIWARLGTRCIQSIQPADMADPPIEGAWPLRAEIAAYLQVSRGISCVPSQIFVTAGYRATLALICHALLGRDDRVWIEDPGFPPTRELLAQFGISTAPVPVDAQGIVVDTAIGHAPQARAAVVTPAHQSPLCMSLSLTRRMALLDWARQADAWIVEDDYDGEYRYVSRPLPALKSLDHYGRVLYAGTFSKVLFPGLRLAYLVVPEAQVERFESVVQAYAGGSPAITQAIVAAFMREGHFARHIQRMRKLYAERRQLTVAGLEGVLGARVRIDAQPGGMHLVLRLPTVMPDRDLVARMRGSGLYAEALSNWSIGPGASPGLLLNFTNVSSREAAEALAQRILALI